MLLEGSTEKAFHLMYGKSRDAGGSQVRRLVIVERVEVSASSHGGRREVGGLTANPVRPHRYQRQSSWAPSTLWFANLQ